MKHVKRHEAINMPCTIAKATSVFGDTWNVLLIRQACLGSKRFDEFQDEIGIGRNILNGRLTVLVDEGVFTKVNKILKENNNFTIEWLNILPF